MSNDLFLVELLSFGERRRIEKSLHNPSAIYQIRRELLELTRRARALPVSPEVILRKIELDVPVVLHSELAALREVLLSRNLRVC